MSRTIESLKKIPSKDNVLNEHIVATYFHQKIPKKKVRYAAQSVKRALAITSAFAITLLLITTFLSIRHYYFNYLREKTASSTVITIFANGSVNREAIKTFAFRGYAKETSRFLDDFIIFNSAKKYSWADLSIDLKFPIDFSARSLLITAKGRIGGERVAVVLKDVNNRCCRLENLYLASNWKMENISFKTLDGDIDLKHITHIRLESDYVGESAMDSPVDFTVFIKDMKILKEG